MFRKVLFSINSFSSRRGSSFILRVPPASAARESPTPLVFVSSRSWDKASSNGTSLLSSILSEKGFTCIQSDLDIPKSSMTNSKTMMEAYERELSSTIRLANIPFPPVIVARQSACLIAQTYISSNAASGLVLISPPTSNAELTETQLPTELEEFNYEPNFPIVVIATPEEVARLRSGNRICQSENVDLVSVKDLDEQQTILEVEKWLDKLGI